MSEMIERITKSVMDGINESGGIICTPCKWDAVPDEFKTGVLACIAKHVLAAMHEPSLAMRDAGMNALLPQTKPHAPELEPMYRDAARLCWDAMLNEALK